MHASVAVSPAARTLPSGLEPALDPDPRPDREPGWPLLATPVPAGFPSPADDYIERRLSLDAHLIRNPESTFLLRVGGDALAAEGIRDGDLLVVDRAAPVTAGSLVVAVSAGAFALRRVGRDARGRRVLHAADPATPNPVLSTDGDVALWGVARWVIHRLWPGRDGA